MLKFCHIMEFFEKFKLIEEFPDERTNEWQTAVSFPVFMAVSVGYVLASYLCVKHMKNRPAYYLDNFLIIYLLTMIFIYTYSLWECIICTRKLGYKLLFDEDKRNNRSPLEMRLLNVAWLMYLAKFFSLFLTFIRILKKRHPARFSYYIPEIFHHLGAFLIAWVDLKWYPTGENFCSAAPPLLHVVHDSLLLFILFILG
ncbi:elongation of very long chain fatty acids protein 2-like [Lutzomyia longipalpis]|uniref:elongation of very long chain fatty acids protein 2-like n=1 Tax=Lutzomyia longipalpis TaxID=7200 RepID=UPI002483C024|nr:elongation of very long chain fatty acids protein 2-like [Lutzomyia longipalpis]